MSTGEASSGDKEYVKIRDDEPNILICYGKRISKHHQVYLGKQILEDGSAKQVAIKLVPASEHHKREIAIMLTLPAHVNTVGYIRSLESKQPPAWYIVMELCKQNLYQLIQHTELTLETKKTILLHIATGLCHIHQNRILHRDLKPQNLLLSLDGLHIKLCDFGLSKKVSEIDLSVSKSAKHIGTEGWGSPESYTMTEEDLEEIIEKMSPKSDVFSAGLVFFFVVSGGKHPCGENSSTWSAAIKDKTPINISGLTVGNGNASTEEALIKHLISSMLMKSPSERPKSDEVLSHALFWDITKRIDLLVYVHQNFTLINNLAPKVRIGKEWCSKLKEIFDGDHTDQNQTTAICAKAESIQAEEGEKEPLFSFLKLVNYYYNELNTQSPNSSFKTAEDMWKYFFNRLPEIFVDIFNWYWKDLPEILSEEFRGRFGKEPPQRKLIPAIDDLRTVIEGRDIHITWNHSSAEPVTYQIRAFCGDNAVDATVTEKRFTIKDAKSSSNLQIEIYAKNQQGSRSPVCDSNINTPPRKPENVTAKLQNSTIVVTWTDQEDDSASEFFVRVVQSECPHGHTESTVVKATSQPFKLNLPLPSRIYSFNVYAVSPGELNGPESDSVSVETNPSQLRDVKATYSPLNRSFNVTWNKPANELVTYCLQRYCDDEPEGREVALTNTEYEFTEATADNQYEFEVWVQNKFGEKAVGKKIKTAKVSLPPKRVEDARISKSGHSLKIEWKPTEVGVKYRVQVLSNNNVLEDTATNEPCYEITAPTPKMNYQFKVCATNKHGVDGESVTLGPVTTKSSAVQGMEIKQITDGLYLSWDKLDPQDAKKYRVQIFRRTISNEKENQEVASISTEDNNYTLVNPTPSMKHMFTIQAMDSWNAYGPTTSSKWVTTAPMEVEELNLKIDKTTKSDFCATWKKIDNHQYRVCVFTNGVRGETRACETEEYKFSVERNCRYFVKVSAINEGEIVGPEKQSNTTMLPPEKVENIKHTFGNNGVRFLWDPSPQATSYTVELRKFPYDEAMHVKKTDETEYAAPTEPSSRYKCTVIARNQYDVAADGTELEISTPPLKVSSLDGKYENKKITFKWPPVAETVAYKLELVKEMQNKKTETILYDKTDTMLSYSAGFSEKHTLSVIAEDKNGMNSTPSSCTIFTPPSRVTITTTAHKDDKIILTWNKLDDPGVEYQVQTFVNGKGQTVKSNGDKTTFYSPNPNGTYRFEVWAKNWLDVEGEKSKSTELKIEPSQPTNGARDQPERHHPETGQTVVMDQGDEPKKDTEERKLPVPQTPKVKADLVGSKIIVKWEAPDDSNSEFYIGVEKKNSSGTIIDQYESKLKGESHEVEPSPSTAYVFKIYGIGESGRGEAAVSDTIRTPPSQLSGLKVNFESDYFHVTWLEPAAQSLDYFLQVYSNGSVHGDVKKLETCYFQFRANSPRDQYFFEVWSRNQFNLDGPKTRTPAVQVPPPRLQNLTVSKNESSISLRWDKIEGDVSYCVQVNSKTNKSADIHITTEPHYEFTTSLPAKNYHFKIWARSKYGTDGPSDTRDWSVPSVEGLELTAIARKFLRATWNAIKGHSFGVKVFKDGVLSNERFLKSNTYVIEAQSSKQYHVEVWAINADGDEGESARSKKAMLVPGCVDRIEHMFNGDLLQISFDQVPGAALYVVKLYEEGSTEPAFSSESTETWAWAKVRLSTCYKLSVRAKNELGESSDETKQEIDSPPGKITSLEAEYCNGQMKFRWDEQKNATYDVQIYSGENNLITEKETGKPRFVQPLRHSKKIRAVIQTRNRNRQLSEAVEKTVCSPPLPVRLTGVNHQDGTVTLKWEKSDELEITYNIQMFCDNEPQSIEERGSDITEITVTELQANKKYHFDIWAMNKFKVIGEKTQSAEIITPKPPSHVVSKLYGGYVDEEIEYKWDSLEREDLKYQVEVLKYVLDKETVIEKILTSNALFSHSAEYSQRYRIRVRVRDISGWMCEPTESSLITTPPQQLRITRVFNNDGAMEIEWEALTDPGVTYNVQPNCDDEAMFTNRNSRTTKYTLANLLPKKRYSFTVWATNQFGENGDKIKSRQLLDGVPGPQKVTKLKAEFINNELAISWNEISQAESYIVEIDRDDLYKNILTAATKETQFTTMYSHLHPSTKYICSVRGRNRDGSEGEKECCHFYLPSVSNIEVKYERGRIFSTWEPVKNSKYRVCIFNNTTGTEKIVKTVVIPEARYSFEFDYSQSYILRVAVDDKNTRQQPQYMNCTIKTPPRPVKITKTKYKNGELHLGWRKSEDRPIKYTIQAFINDQPQLIKRIDGTETKYQMRNVSPSKDRYFFDVRAVNDFGVESDKRRSKTVIPATRTIVTGLPRAERRDPPESSSAQDSDSASLATPETGVSAGSERASTSSTDRGALARVISRVRATMTASSEQREERRGLPKSSSEEGADIASNPTTHTSVRSPDEERRPLIDPGRVARTTADSEAIAKTTSVFKKD